LYAIVKILFYSWWKFGFLVITVVFSVLSRAIEGKSFCHGLHLWDEDDKYGCSVLLTSSTATGDSTVSILCCEMVPGTPVVLSTLDMLSTNGMWIFTGPLAITQSVLGAMFGFLSVVLRWNVYFWTVNSDFIFSKVGNGYFFSGNHR